jgi:two-component system catabolic regulation response regulator CreB/two-component system response regulator ChvI
MARRKCRILAVDDEPDITATFKKALEKAGFEVDTFNDPLEALSHFRQDHYYDLLLLDIKMPNLNGFGLYKELRKIDSKPKVCFITAFEMYYDEFVKVFPSMPVKCFIRKPISSSDLVKQIKAELELEQDTGAAATATD